MTCALTPCFYKKRNKKCIYTVLAIPNTG